MGSRTVAGVLLAVAVVLSEDPPRGGAEAETETGPRHWGYAKR